MRVMNVNREEQLSNMQRVLPLQSDHVEDTISVEYCDIGDPSHNCAKCGALFWFEERTLRSSTKTSPKYSLCCKKGMLMLILVRIDLEM
ncbi:unnamed protein product [Cuscuta epithymum]|uniref:Uncharacterized protein n=1 Tax=Cuscuta epithymum TaxID=186058 RepID=A0AAV0CYZ7_9ASTE|nr:unnamed protein product [Cuscuta epithymum]